MRPEPSGMQPTKRLRQSSRPATALRLSALACAAAAGLLLCGAAPNLLAPPLLFDVGTSRSISLSELALRVQESNVILFGEHHNSAEDHEAQLLFIREMVARKKSLAVAMEVFSFESQPVLDAFVAGEAGDLALYQEFTKASSPELFHQYEKIVNYLRDARIPLVGIRAETGVLLKLFFRGARQLTPEDEARLPGYDPTCNVSDKHELLMKLFARTAVPFSYVGPDKGNVCDFFMGLDSVMGYKIAEYVKANPDRTLIVLAGAVHAWKQGIPYQVRKHVAARVSVILPSSSKDPFLGYQVYPDDADFVWWRR